MWENPGTELLSDLLNNTQERETHRGRIKEGLHEVYSSAWVARNIMQIVFSVHGCCDHKRNTGQPKLEGQWNRESFFPQDITHCPGYWKKRSSVIILTIIAWFLTSRLSHTTMCWVLSHPSFAIDCPMLCGHFLLPLDWITSFIVTFLLIHWQNVFSTFL